MSATLAKAKSKEVGSPVKEKTEKEAAQPTYLQSIKTCLHKISKRDKVEWTKVRASPVPLLCVSKSAL